MATGIETGHHWQKGLSVVRRHLLWGLEITLTVFVRLVICVVALSGHFDLTAADSPSLAAYLHPEQCFSATDPIPQRELAIRDCLDDVVEAGLRTIVPYISTTSGIAHYPSDLLPKSRWDGWDPIDVFVREARQRNLNVHLCVPLLACGHATAAGVLLEHPDWALRSESGEPIGTISSGHPDARQWMLSWMDELISRYNPDGVLLDYFRFASQATQLDPVSAERFVNESDQLSDDTPEQRVHNFREQLLTELMESVSDRLRSQKPQIHIAIYSWGHHVTDNHRLAQDWPTWAKRGYIDEVNVCGYWFPETYPRRWGDNHIEAFRTVLSESRRLLDEGGGDTKLTFALGVRTSHGQVKTVVDIASYLNEATRQQVDGVNFFTWSYLVPFVPQLKTWKLIPQFAERQVIPDLTTANIDHRSGASTDQPQLAVTPGNGKAEAATVVVATANSSQAARESADFVGDGQGDQAEINTAIRALPEVGGTVLLAEGTYDIRREPGTLGGVLIGRSHVVLAGRGSATRLVLAADQNTNVIRIIGSGIQHVTIRDLAVDANRAENHAGQGDTNISHDRFEYCGIKGYCRDPRGPGAEDLQHITVRNCEVRNAHRLGIMLEGSDLNVIDNLLGNAGSDVVELLTGPGMIRGNTVEITGQTHVAIGSDRGNSIQMSDNIVRVKPGGKLDIGFRTWANSQRHVINGNVLIVDDGGQCGLAMDLRGQMQTVAGNSVESLNGTESVRIRIGGGNTVLTGNLFRNVLIEVHDTYHDDKSVLLQSNILDNSAVKHVPESTLD